MLNNARDFLTLLSEKIPKIFENNISQFLGLFESEAY